jgi:hypothetical protein
MTGVAAWYGRRRTPWMNSPQLAGTTDTSVKTASTRSARRYSIAPVAVRMPGHSSTALPKEHLEHVEGVLVVLDHED